MLRRLSALLVMVCFAVPASAQLSVGFQEGVNGYAGTRDTEFRSGDAATPQGDKEFVTVDEFDNGNQVQGAIRFENIFGNQPGLVPTGVTIGFATLSVWSDSASDPKAVIGFHRVLAASPWDENSTWFSLGGDLIPDEGGLLDGDPILQNNIESLETPDAVVPSPQISDRFIDLDVTASVQAWYAGAANLGWGINNDTGNGWDIFSSEFVDPVDPLDFSKRPQLTIGYFLKPGDLDFDNDVDPDDYDFLLENLAIQLNGPIAQGSNGDLDFDRDVDLDDFSIFKNLYPGGAGGLAAALSARSSVPEPTTAAMAACAVFGLISLRRRTD